MRKAILALASAFILLPSPGMAAGGQLLALFNAPEQVSSLASLKNSRKMKEQNVIIEGKIIYQITHDSFMFSDGIVMVVINLSEDVRLKQDINEDTPLRLFGEYSVWGDEFSVERIKILNHSE